MMKKLLVCTALLISFLLMNTTNLLATNTFKISANGRFIVDSNEAPFYPQNDWGTKLLWKVNLTDATSYLTTRKAQLFNIITAFAVDSGGDTPNFASVNINGDAPFELTVGGGDYDGRWNVLAPVEDVISLCMLHSSGRIGRYGCRLPSQSSILFSVLYPP